MLAYYVLSRLDFGHQTTNKMFGDYDEKIQLEMAAFDL